MIRKKTLLNGLTIVAERIPFVRSITMGIWVGHGSRYESKKMNGASHFIEHMLFKGTQSRTAKEIAEQMDQIGGQINAFTAKEYTCYYTRALDTHFDLALDVLTDMFFNSIFAEEEIQKERSVILEEINMYEDSPEDQVHDMLQSAVWKDSLGYPILGTEETLASFNQANLKAYMRENYYPQNTVIAVVGHFEYEELFEKLECAFKDWPSLEVESNQAFNTVYLPEIYTKEKDIEQVHTCLGFPGIPIGKREIYAISILNTILGGSMSSRLFQKIREEHGLAYSVYSYTSSYQQTGIFTIYAGMNPMQTKKVIELILEELTLLKQKSISQKEINQTKEQLKSSYMMGLESTSGRMNTIGKSQLLQKRIQTPDEIIKKIDQVTKEDIDELIDSIFDFSKMSVSAIGKIEDTSIKEIIQPFI
ncbi:MAG: insulinase family protein [Epulopiscium sp.]|nr:insulinase family protein [Candidatus Epulonipiscium sp.]